VVPVGRLSGRACPRPWGEARGTSTCDVAVAASSCCGPATATVTRDGFPIIIALAVATSACCGPVTEAGTRDGSLVTAALTLVRVTLAKRRPVVAGAPDLSALAGAMAGMIDVTMSTREQKSKRHPSKSKAREGRCCSPQVGETPLPLARGLGGTSVAPAGISSAHAGASTDSPAAGASAPTAGTNSTAASPARGDRSRGFHLSRVALPHHSPPPRLTTSSPAPAEGRVLAAHATGTLSCTAPGAPAA
jgi:hypothetical protein